MLASPAPLWLLDEPTVALDTRSVERLRSAIAAHRETGGMVVASTNVPLGIEDAASIDVSAFTRYDETLWGDAVGEDPAAGDWE